MSVQLTFIGMKELKAALLRLPAELTELSEAIVVEAAESAAAEVRAAYPIGPGKADGTYDGGNLRKGVRVTQATRGTKLEAQFAVGRVVRSSAPHAYLFEVGTKVRYNISRNKQLLNKPAHRGFMPGANIFVPVMERHRREMLEDLTAVVEQAGLEVRGR